MPEMEAHSCRTDWSQRFYDARASASSIRCAPFEPEKWRILPAKAFARPPCDNRAVVQDVIRRMIGSRKRLPGTETTVAAYHSDYRFEVALQTCPSVSFKVATILVEALQSSRVDRKVLHKRLSAMEHRKAVWYAGDLLVACTEPPVQLRALTKEAVEAHTHLTPCEWMVCPICKGTSFKPDGATSAAVKFKQDIGQFYFGNHLHFATVCTRCNALPVVRVDLRFYCLELGSMHVLMCSKCQQTARAECMVMHTSAQFPFLCRHCVASMLHLQYEQVDPSNPIVWSLCVGASKR